MTLRIHELRDDQCRFVLNDKRPFFCCGEPINRGAYCECHAKRCYSGKKMKPWAELAEMIYATEQTIVRTF